jgi:hypothetical protein
MDGSSPAINLSYPRFGGGISAERFLAAFLLMGAIFATYRWVEPRSVMAGIRRWPHAVGCVVGLAWWLWLSPSALGLAIVLMSVLSRYWHFDRDRSGILN